MFWLTWRQYRVALLIGIALLALYGLLFLAEMQSYFRAPLDLVGLVPLVVAVFVGAPFMAQEREQKTHYVVWGQGTSRGRWFLSRLAWVTLCVVVIAGLFCWSANMIEGWRESIYTYTYYWGRPGISPLALTLFGLMLGVAVGSFTRKTIVAMAITFALLLVCFVAYPQVEHRLIPSHVQYVEYEKGNGWGNGSELMLSISNVDRQGNEIGGLESYCRAHESVSTANVNQCIKDFNIQWKMVYLTPDQFWPMEFAGAALLLVVSLVLALVAYLRIRSAVD